MKLHLIASLAFCVIWPSNTSEAATGILYAKLGQKYFVNQEEKSCVLYIDNTDGTSLRLSNRTDEKKLYISIYNSGFINSALVNTAIKPTMLIYFKDAKWTFASSGVIIQTPTFITFSAAEFDPDDIFRKMLTNSTISVRMMFVQPGAPTTILTTIDINDAGIPIAWLKSCSDKHFPTQM